MSPPRSVAATTDPGPRTSARPAPNARYANPAPTQRAGDRSVSGSTKHPSPRRGPDDKTPTGPLTIGPPAPKSNAKSDTSCDAATAAAERTGHVLEACALAVTTRSLIRAPLRRVRGFAAELAPPPPRPARAARLHASLAGGCCSASGCGGCRPEYLVALGERMEDRKIERLEAFVLSYTAGSLLGCKVDLESFEASDITIACNSLRLAQG